MPYIDKERRKELDKEIYSCTMAKKVLITGSAGLIGSEATKFFAEKGFEVLGIDNNFRAYFFGFSIGMKGSKNPANGVSKIILGLLPSITTC